MFVWRLVVRLFLLQLSADVVMTQGAGEVKTGVEDKVRCRHTSLEKEK